MLVYLLILFDLAVEQKYVALALAIEDPGVIDDVVVVYETLIRVLDLLQLLRPVFVLHSDVYLVV